MLNFHASALDLTGGPLSQVASLETGADAEGLMDQETACQAINKAQHTKLCDGINDVCQSSSCETTDYCTFLKSGCAGTASIKSTTTRAGAVRNAPALQDPAATVQPSGQAKAQPVAGGGGAPPSGGTANPSVAQKASALGGDNPAANSQTPSGSSPGTSKTSQTSDDLTTCTNLQSDATSFCNDALNTPVTQPAAASGLNGACQSGQDVATQSAQAQVTAGNTCYSKIANCQNTCAQLQTSHSDQTSSFQSQISTCNALTSTASQITTTANNSLSVAKSASNCTNSSSSGGGIPSLPSSLSSDSANSPQSQSDQLQQAQNMNSLNDPTGCIQNPTSPACIMCQNPGNFQNPICQSLAAAAQAQNHSGQAGFQVVPPLSNTGSLAAGSPGDGLSTSTQFGNFKPTASPSSPVPNQGGSWAGNQGSGSPSSANSMAARGPSPGDPGYSTKIEQGLRSGGGGGDGGGGGGGSGSGPGGSGGSEGYGAAARGLASLAAAHGIDLKKYLPGSQFDPNRRLGGLSSEIANRSGDVWKSISNRYLEKCRLGELIDCR
jgi:hypothetical protein